MAELKKGFAELEYENVVSYLNSGNVVFSTESNDENTLSSEIESMIKDRFNLDIPTLVVLQDELKNALNNAPDWWGGKNKDVYDNLIFLMPPLLYKEFFDEIGELKAEYEKAINYKDVVFWSFSLKDYRKTNW